MFPLCWPDGWSRTKNRQPSRFKVGSVYEAVEGLRVELDRMGARNIIISTSIPLRRDGLPLSKPPVDGDPGAAVYFLRSGQPLCLACDQYQSVQDNIHAIAKTIDALRGIERWGSTDLLNRAFTGFAALPNGSDRHWSEVLMVPRDATRDAIDRAYRDLVKRLHPDVGGNSDDMAALNVAYDQAKAEVPA